MFWNYQYCRPMYALTSRFQIDHNVAITWCSCGTAGFRFTHVSRALQSNPAKIYNARNNIYCANFKLKLWKSAHNIALCPRTEFQLEIIKRSTISQIPKSRESTLLPRETLVNHPWLFTYLVLHHKWMNYGIPFVGSRNNRNEMRSLN